MFYPFGSARISHLGNLVCSSCSSAPRDFRVRALTVLGRREMGAKKRAFNTQNAGEKKVKKSVGCTNQPEDDKLVPVEAGEENSNLGIDILRKDHSRLEAMSVKELRAVIKDTGINASGRKQDLISALRNFLLKGEDESAPLTSEDALPITKAKAAKGAPTKKCQTTVEESSKTSLQEMLPAAISDEPWAILAHKKPKPGWVPYNPKTMQPPSLPDSIKSLKLISWNVNGLRALLRSGGLEVVQRENFDVLCLQETKMQERDVYKLKDRLIEGYDNSFWTCSVSKLGYSGTAVISRIKPISVKYGLGIQDHDGEGRLVTVEFDTFYLLSVYVPNSGEGLKRLTYRITEWDTALSNYMKDLEKSKPVILTGDLNCAHEEIDIYNPAGNRRCAGFTDEERQSFEKNFLSRGFVDTFRRQYPGVVGYTYWGFRHGLRKANKGWRLDYFLVSESIADDVHNSYIMPDVVGSDHCPIGLVLKV